MLGFNRTIEELKRNQLLIDIEINSRFNRTIEELKLMSWIKKPSSPAGFNRTIEELKHDWHTLVTFFDDAF